MAARICLTLGAAAAAAVVIVSLLLPRPSPATASGAGALGAGGAHACVVVTGGGVKCWGYNLYGQVGDRTTTNRAAPVSVCADDPCTNALSGVASLGGGSLHTCAVTTGGGVKCWGNNEFGQLGNGTTSGGAANPTPLNVCGNAACTSNLSGVASIDGGSSHTCALTTTGRVKCWGLNTSGQLGDGTTTLRTTPVEVCASGSGSGCPVLTGVVAITAGSAHTCAVTTGGAVKCWGANSFGQLGDGSTTGNSLPVDVLTLGSGVAAVSAAGGYTCALTTSGGVKCWGNNEFGQLGNGTTSGTGANSSPVDVCQDAACTSSLTGIASIAAGSRHTCAVTTAGGVKCWGYNLYGELGNHDAPNDRTTPVDVCADATCSTLLSGIAAVAAADFHTCARTEFQAVICWGRNDIGQLGDSNAPNHSDTPRNVVGLGAKPTPTSTSTPTYTPTATRTPTATKTPTMTSTPKTPPTPKDTPTANPSASGSLKIDADCGTAGVQTKRYVLLNGTFHVCVEAAFPSPGSASGYQARVVWTASVLQLHALTANVNDLWGDVPPGLGGPPTNGSSSQNPDPTLDGFLLLSTVDTGQLNGTPVYNGPVANLEFVCQSHAAAKIDLSLAGNSAGSIFYSGTNEVKTTLAQAVIICLDPTDDSDRDGCPTLSELQTAVGSETTGGRRDPLNRWDYFNPTHDGKIRVDDILKVVHQFFKDSGNPAYNLDTDRTYVGPNAWNLGPPNGQQRVDDILNVVQQFFHDCS
jgi:alpha-tubulin suppressor-like RCC1 family protein